MKERWHGARQISVSLQKKKLCCLSAVIVGWIMSGSDVQCCVVHLQTLSNSSLHSDCTLGLSVRKRGVIFKCTHSQRHFERVIVSTRPIVSFTSWTAEALFHVHNFNRAEFKRTVRKVYSRWYELQRCLGEKRWCVKIINLYYFSE